MLSLSTPHKRRINSKLGNFRQQNHLLASYNIILEIFELILKKEKGCISPMILTKALQTVYT